MLIEIKLGKRLYDYQSGLNGILDGAFKLEKLKVEQYLPHWVGRHGQFLFCV